MSSLASQLLAAEKPTDILVGGIPIAALKSLVARQMSMAAQLLVQLILHAPEDSTVYQDAYNAFLELSNMRIRAVKQMALLHMNMKNLSKFQSGGRRTSGDDEGD